MTNTSQRFIAETIGTFALATMIFGSILVGQTGLVPAIAGGLILMTMVYAFGSTSGAHFNPAVTISCAIAKRISWNQVGYYIVAQLVGAFLAVSLLQLMLPQTASVAATLPSLAPTATVASAIFAEALATFFLCFTVLAIGGTTLGGVAIGSCIVLAAILAGPISGGSINPALYLSSALMSGEMSQLVTYLAGPIIGGLVAGLIVNYLASSGASSMSQGGSASSNTNSSSQQRRAA